MIYIYIFVDKPFKRFSNIVPVRNFSTILYWLLKNTCCVEFFFFQEATSQERCYGTLAPSSLSMSGFEWQKIIVFPKFLGIICFTWLKVYVPWIQVNQPFSSKNKILFSSIIHFSLKNKKKSISFLYNTKFGNYLPKLNNGSEKNVD